MATFKGNHITAFDATPAGVVNSRLHGGVLKHCRDTVSVVDNSAGDIYHFFRLPIDAVLTSVKFGADALSGGTLDIGFYKKNNDGTYSAVDVDAIASAVAVTSASAPTEVLFEAAAADLSKANQPIWQRSGLSARPSYADLYISITTATETTATGDVILEVTYTE